ncbi:MAG TPA: NAD(P)H-hydrate dehydratase [Armatimonadota bacterium]|nr:NAD(P)H-hydrate dehydratase [Armatimonadota bacterium]
MNLCTADQMRSMDRRAVEAYGMPSLLLMENAGRAVAERALQRLPERGEVWIWCGKGNNGGDGFVAARHLWNRGVPVRVLLAADPVGLKGDARTNFDLLPKLGVAIHRLEGAIPPGSPALQVDALLGTGFHGEPAGEIADALRALAASAAPILAVDIPSGLNTDTGQPASLCVRAVETVTFGLPKVGLVTCPGRDYAGELTVAEISLPRPLLEEVSSLHWIDAVTAAPYWPERAPEAHKGDSGRLFILAGSAGLTGAAVMVAEAALRAGAGLVTVGAPRSQQPILAAKLTEAMTLPLPETESGGHSPESLEQVRERLAAGAALAVGPGFGRDPRSAELLRALLPGCPAPCVVDADALTLLSPADEHTFPSRCVLTPHPGEMARLLGTEVPAVQSNRLEVAKSAAARFGCVVLLKGAATVIAAPDGRAAINSSGGPALATGGTGDVLTGVIGACMARGLEPYAAAVAGAFLHGLAGEVAGERFGAPGTIAGDVIAAIPEALRRLHRREVPLPYRCI